METKPNVGDAIELDEMDIMLAVPKDACALEVTVIMMDDNNETYKVSKRISPAELTKAREDFVNYIGDDYDATYVLSDVGRQWLEAMKNGKESNS